MITANLAELHAFKWVKSCLVASHITGGVYRNVRPTDSKKEDIVINVLTATGNESNQQDFVININLHIPSLKVGTSFIPNNARFDELESYIMQDMTEAFNEFFTIWTDAPNKILDREVNEWFLNLRVRMKFHNNLLN